MRSLVDHAGPVMGSAVIHAAVLMLVLMSWAPTEVSFEPRPASVVQASLVSLPKPKPKPRAVVAPPKPEPRPDPAPVVAPEPEPVVAQPEPEPEPVEVDEPQVDPSELERERLEQLLAIEGAELQADQDTALIDQYTRYIVSEIEQTWNRPPSARNGMVVTLEIALVPSGDVVAVKVLQSSGNAAVDRAAVLAVERIGRFSQLRGMPGRLFDENFRPLVIRFIPEDLRL